MGSTLPPVYFPFSSSICYICLSHFLPMPLAGAWVNRWTCSPPPPFSNLQLMQRQHICVPTWPKKAQVLFLTGQEKHKFLWGGRGSLAVYAILFFLHLSCSISTK